MTPTVKLLIWDFEVFVQKSCQQYLYLIPTEGFLMDFRASMMLFFGQPRASNVVLCRIRLILKFNIIKVNKIVKFLA